MGNRKSVRSSTLSQVTTPNLRFSLTTIPPPEIIHKENHISIQKIKQISTLIDLSDLSSPVRSEALKTTTGPNLELCIKNHRKIENILLTPSGCEGLKRQSKDGVTYFGHKHKDTCGNIVVDYKLTLCSTNLGKARGAHFLIHFNPFAKKYFVRDLNVGLGTFIRIKDQVVLQDNQILSFGETFILVNILPTEDNPKLRLKVIGGNNFSEVFYFGAQEFYLSSIVIGRHSKCQVSIEDTTISKQHASIFFSINKQWVVIDGTATRNSLNGSWLFVSKDFELSPGCEIKACESLIKVLPDLNI